MAQQFFSSFSRYSLPWVLLALFFALQKEEKEKGGKSQLEEKQHQQ
jgi:hypothetical protein